MNTDAFLALAYGEANNKCFYLCSSVEKALFFNVC